MNSVRMMNGTNNLEVYLSRDQFDQRRKKKRESKSLVAEDGALFAVCNPSHPKCEWNFDLMALWMIAHNFNDQYNQHLHPLTCS